jgi:hypothetical protein
MGKHRESVQSGLQALLEQGSIQGWRSKPLGIFEISTLDHTTLTLSEKEAAMWVLGVAYGRVVGITQALTGAAPDAPAVPDHSSEAASAIVEPAVTEADRALIQAALEKFARIEILDSWELVNDRTYRVTVEGEAYDWPPVATFAFARGFQQCSHVLFSLPIPEGAIEIMAVALAEPGSGRPQVIYGADPDTDGDWTFQLRRGEVKRFLRRDAYMWLLGATDAVAAVDSASTAPADEFDDFLGGAGQDADES